MTLIEALPLPAAGTTTVAVRLAGGGSRAYTHKGHSDWLSGVASRPRFTTAIGFDASGPTGGAIPQTGNIRFSTVDKARLSTIAGYYWTGARIVVSVGDDSLASPTWTVIMTGTVADAKTDGAGILFTISDLSGDLNKVVCPDTFAGSGGIEGGADATGRIKRRSWGQCFNVEALLLDMPNNIYEVGDPSQPIFGIAEVRDKAVAAQSMTVIAWAGSIAATFAALQAAAVTTGGCAVAPSIACVKWWTVPSGPLTCDLQGEVNTGAFPPSGYSDRPADIALIVLLAYTPSITFANYAAVNAALAVPSGIHCDDASETISSLLNRLFLPLFYVPIFDASGSLNVRQITFSAPVETLTFDTCDRDTVFPPLLLRSVGYKRNYRLQSDGEIAADIDALGAFTLIPRANVYIAGSTVAKVSGAAAYGNASAYSREAYTTPVLNFTVPKAPQGGVFGFRKAATAYSGYASLSEGFDFSGSVSTVYARTGATTPASATFHAGSTFQLKDDGTSVHFIVDGVEIWASASDGSAKVFDSDFLRIGDEINNISFSATGAAGAAGIAPYLTNPAVTVSSAADGTGASYTAAGGSLILNLGGVPIVSGVSYSVVSGSPTGGLSISINPTTGAYLISGLTGDDGSAVLRAHYNGHDYDLVYSISKSKTGAAAPVLTLQPTANAFTYDSTGTLTGATSISVPAVIQGVTGTATYTAQAYNSANTLLGSVTLGGSGNNRTLSAANFLTFPTTAYVVITATLGSIGDVSTIYKLVAGSNVITAILTNEAATVAADSGGSPTSGYGAAGGTMQLFSGAAAITSGVSYSVVSGSPTGGLSISINPTTGAYLISALTSDSGSCTLRATYNSIPYDKVYNLSKSKAGFPGSNGVNGIGTTALGLSTGVTFDGTTLDCSSNASGVFTVYGAWSLTTVASSVVLAWKAPNAYGNPTDEWFGLRSAPSSTFDYNVFDIGAIRHAAQATGFGSSTTFHTEVWINGSNIAVDKIWDGTYSYSIRYDFKTGVATFSAISPSGVITPLCAPQSVGAGKAVGAQAIFGKRGRFTNPTFGPAGSDGTGGSAIGQVVTITSVSPADAPTPLMTVAAGGVVTIDSFTAISFTANPSTTYTTQLQYSLDSGSSWLNLPGGAAVGSQTVTAVDTFKEIDLSTTYTNTSGGTLKIMFRAHNTKTGGTASLTSQISARG